MSTYRLQFNRSFTFGDATAVVEYLHLLGISDCYASSYLTAVPGSPHGYDVADPTGLNPELGSEDDYWRWIHELDAHRMGHVLDLVPNHMGIAKSANPWWSDVLENGPSSRFAHFFDISWHPIKEELRDKLLIPILGDQYGAVLERQELRLTYQDGAFAVQYFDNVLPIAADTFATVLGIDLDRWVAEHAGSDADELQSILEASRHLPPRHSRQPEDIATRAREKEVVKRRLSALWHSSPAVQALVQASLDHFNGAPGNPRSFDPLDRLLNEQSYRLAHWRVASEEINYRRFFDVNQLAAVRMEDPTVFDEVHRFAFELVRRGAATGLRVDHVDGLYAPGDYLRRLQERCRELLGDSADRESSDSATRPFFIVVEKILTGHEQLPAGWPVAGTTGYEFSAVVNNLFVDHRNEDALDTIYSRFRRERIPFADLVYRCKKQVMHETMSGDINSLGHQLNRFSERNRHFRDFTLYNLISTIKEVIACFPVYRTYVTEQEPVSEQDERSISSAVRWAKRRSAGSTPVVFDFIERLLLKRTAVASAEECRDRARFIGKFQQITSPVAAKGMEDTALYLENRLVSLNEVGADPTEFGLEPAAVHEWLSRRQHQWPSALSATSTHDTKRGEDVRARLNVLSEMPGAWSAAVTKWRTLNRRFKTDVSGGLAPDPNEEYLLYQTLVGAWPFEAQDDFTDRICAYFVKALREAKAHTSWINPDAPYEQAAERFVRAILDPKRAGVFLDSFIAFQSRVAELGIYNSLAQLLIKITAPGIPDFYQGTELWDLCLVDPDNRRPVDYARRKQLLDALRTASADDEEALAAELLERRADGRIKMFVTMRALAVRESMMQAFAGEYVPLRATGIRRDSVFAFARAAGREYCVTCVPRLVGSVVDDAAVPPIGGVWLDTRVELPPGAPCVFRHALTGARIESDRQGDVATLPVEALFDRFPAALLTCSI